MSALNWIGVISLFPEMFDSVSNYGVTGRALRKGIFELHRWNPRDFTLDKHRTVDDRPYGGGPGMLMMVQPLQDAIRAAKAQAGEGVKTIYLSPQGKKFDQVAAHNMAQQSKLLLVCGRYEGIDERLIESEIDEEWSVGDFVLSGGELPAMTLIDAVTRLLPGVLGHNLSAEQDSFQNGLLDCPHYTRPEVLNDKAVPPILLSGDHAKIEQWRMQQALGRTWLRRPELLTNLALTDEQKQLLETFQTDYLQE